MSRLLLIILTLLVCRDSAAQESFWRLADGPYGGTVVSAMVAFEHSALLAATSGGVFRSDDLGDTWRPYSEALPAVDVRALLRLDDGSVLAATNGDGVFRRGEGMGSWISTGLRGTTTLCLSADSSGTIYAGTAGGLTRSTNNGLNWKTVGFFKNVFGGVKAVAANKRYIFAATVNGIFRSSDEGVNWEPAMSGLRETEVTVLAANEAGDVYAGTSPSTGIAGLYRTRDDGDTWTRMPLSGNAYQLSAIGFDADGGVYAGGYKMVYRSKDGGENWQQVNAVETSIHSFAFFDDTLLIGTYGRGVLHARADDLEFTESNHGLHSRINDMAVIEGVLYAGTSGGVYASLDYGRTWFLRNDGLEAMHVSTLAVDGSGRLIAGTRNGVYRLYETPHVWNRISPQGMPELREIAVGADGTLYGGYHSGLYVAGNTGVWTQVPVMGEDASYRDVIALAVDKAGKVFAGSFYDSFRSEGAVPAQSSYVNWMELTMASGNSAGVRTFETSEDGFVYAGTTYEGVVRSSDGGDTWSNFGSGLVGTEEFFELEATPGGLLYGAAYGSGVIEYDPSSNRWNAVNQGLHDLRVTSLAFDDEGYGYAATLGGGLYVHDPVMQVGAEMAPAHAFPETFSLEGNYPNPFNPATTIRIHLPSSATVTVDIYDALGRRVMHVPAREMAAGFGREIGIESGDLATGMYAYRVDAAFAGASVRSVAGTMILMK